MNITQRARKVVKDPFESFKAFEGIIATICLTIPLLLRFADPHEGKFRSSISAYVCMHNRHIFGMLLCMAAMLFVFNGAVYFKNANQFGLRKEGRWYNVVLGISLLGVIIFRYDKFVWEHYSFAVIFFVGNALVIGFFHKKKYKMISRVLAVLTLASFLVYFAKWISLFTAEWISLGVIGIHFILEARGIIDFAREKNIYSEIQSKAENR